MADLDAEQTGSIDPQGEATTEGGFLHMEAVQEDEATPEPLAAVPTVAVKPAIALTPQARERAGTAEDGLSSPAHRQRRSRGGNCGEQWHARRRNGIPPAWEGGGILITPRGLFCQPISSSGTA